MSTSNNKPTLTTRLYRTADGLLHLDPGEQKATLYTVVKWTILGGAVGILSGTASAIFLAALSWATNTRVANPLLLLLLPLAGFVIGWTYWRYAGNAARGNELIIEEVYAIKQTRVPLRMAPMVLIATVLTHLFGGSVGRESVAIQIGGSLADSLRRVLRLDAADRRLMLMAGISGGFGSIFGTPIAGFVFGMEVQDVGRIRYEGLIPCLVASVVGNLVTRAWGISHTVYPRLANIEADPILLIKVAIAGIVFGLTSLLFIELLHGIKRTMAQVFKWSPLRPVIGALIVIGLTLLVGSQDYLGLSVPLIQHTMDGTGVIAFAFVLKFIFTAVSLGSGFPGGEATPLFVIGSTLGYSLGRLLGVDPGFMAAIGFVAVFGGASNTPLACTLVGLELFGGGSVLYLAIGCFVAYLVSGHRGIYGTQRVNVPKAHRLNLAHNESLKAVAERRSGWLSALARSSRIEPQGNADPQDSSRT